MISGQYVPISYLTLKQYVPNPKIWKNDDSFLRFVSVGIPLSERNYRPTNLNTLSGSNINQAWRNSYIREDVKPFLLSLAKDFQTHFKEPIVAISAFRSADYQQRLWDLGRCDSGAFCAKPWESEHQLGLTIDFFNASSELEYIRNKRYKAYVEWMYENAPHHGWTQSYKHWPEIDGYEIEPWHWRFIGVETAKFLQKINISYTKFLQLERMIGQF